ncbi:aspartate--tRNA ligase [Aceticella autotrophica]|uniref:Aspartate--tRNA ligase n=1 Tax=Aceticella autotrophica TaxID=2755338 RepID=A0A975AUB9_9THEO|nr:aspartate--tRNA ligase [Aceticella autotrophica]QSZ26581.1 aspartate--tRNA ligase [Aceticella autotrophica]
MEKLKRTHMCGELTLDDINKEVVLMGWVQKRRDLGGLVFIELRDRTGLIQIVFNEQISKEAFDKVQSVRTEYVLAVKGKVVKRSDETINLKLKTGKIEVYVETLKILSKSETPPFMVEEDNNVSEAVRLKFRYIDLRRPSMQKTFMTRYKITKLVREYLDKNGFIDIETPLLIRSTPEGARDYLVPSRVQPGKFYALPQSPQIFKQLLMLSGFDRYYQITKCLRDEDLRADRQPEFTQIDMEMSFIDVDDILSLNEKMIAKLFKEILDVDVSLPFKRMTYQEAMDRFGSDKPDMRFDMQLKDLTDIVSNCSFKVFNDAILNKGSVRAINVKGAAAIPRRQIDELIEFVKTYKAKGMVWIQVMEEGIKSPVAKFLTDEEMSLILKRMEADKGDLILMIADKNNSVVYDSLGHLRLEMGRRFNLIDKNKYEFLWVLDFPLLEYSEEEKRYVAMHHPFTSPKDEDLELLDSNPGSVRAKAYDMVINGVEIGGGSIRIHDTELQKKMFKILGFSDEAIQERFGFLVDAFKYGAPPHGGIAYGLDRLTMLMTGTENIRDVIAFPKTQNAVCLMTDAPSLVSEGQLEELHIKIEK